MPAALLDAEFIIADIIRKHFEKTGEWTDIQGGGSEIDLAVCPQCRQLLREQWEDYNIYLSRSFVTPIDGTAPASRATWVLGFQHFQGFEPQSVHDFQRADSIEAFVNSLLNDEV